MENNDRQIKHKSASDEFLSGSLNYLDDIKDVKVAKRRRSLKPIMIAILAIIGLFGGVAAMLNTSKHPIEETAIEDYGDEVPDAQVQLNSCLRAAQADVEAGDPEFYPKLIASYKVQITCYDRYDNESLAKKDLEDKLTSVEVAARDAGTSQAAIDAEYDRRAAQIDEEHRRYMADLDAKAAEQEAETERWLQEDAEAAAKRQAEWEAEQAEYEAQQVRCNAFKQKYSNQDSLTVAQNDSEVQVLWQQYEEAQKQYQEASSALTGALQSGSSQRTIDYWQTELSRRNSLASSVHARYNAALQQVKLNYERERSAACGY